MRGLLSGWRPPSFHVLQPLPGCHLKDAYRIRFKVCKCEPHSIPPQKVLYLIAHIDKDSRVTGISKAPRLPASGFGNIRRIDGASKNSPSEMRSNSVLRPLRSMRIIGEEDRPKRAVTHAAFLARYSRAPPPMFRNGS